MYWLSTLRFTLIHEFQHTTYTTRALQLWVDNTILWWNTLLLWSLHQSIILCYVFIAPISSFGVLYLEKWNYTIPATWIYCILKKCLKCCHFVTEDHLTVIRRLYLRICYHILQSTLKKNNQILNKSERQNLSTFITQEAFVWSADHTSVHTGACCMPSWKISACNEQWKNHWHQNFRLETFVLIHSSHA